MTFYLICYDITDDRRRTRVAKLLEAYGLRVQKSVFECVLDDRHRERLQGRLLKLLDPRKDQLRFYSLSDRCRSQVEILGIQPKFAIDDISIVV